VGKSQKERQAEYERRLRASGGRVIKVALDSETAQRFDEILELTGMDTNKAVIKNAILALHIKVKSVAADGKLKKKGAENADA
jgi:hypothetical protein